LLASIPVLTVPVLVGGLSIGEVWRISLVLLDTLFFSLAVGIFVSSISHSGRRALAGTLGLLLLVAAGPPCLGLIIVLNRGSSSFPVEYLVSSPGFAFAQAFDYFFKTTPQLYWESLGLIHALAWAFLGSACLVAPRTWQERPAGSARVRWRERWLWLTHGNPAQRAKFRRRLLEHNPYYWLAARMRMKAALVWGILGLLLAIWCWCAIQYWDEWLVPPTYILTAVLLNCLLKYWVAWENGRQLAEDHRSGGLELLLCTPLTVEDILRGQFRALCRQFLGPLLAVLGIFAVFLAACVNSSRTQADEVGDWIGFWMLGGIALPMDLFAIHLVGQWSALQSPNPARMVGGVVLRILLLPWFLFGMALFAIAIFAMYTRKEPPDQVMFWISLWFGLGVAVDACFAGLAYHNLKHRFRRAAATRYSGRRTFWKRWLRPSGSP
jgi:hypothetical protein